MTENLPIFGASKPKTKAARPVRTLKIGSLSIPVTVEEFAPLEARVLAHVEKHGVAFGFVNGLLQSDV